MGSDNDPNLVRDAMLTRMAMATPGGPLFRQNPPGFPRMFEDAPPDKEPVRDMNLDTFDEAQAFATSRKGLATHSALMRVLGGWAIEIRRQLDAGHTVVLSAGGREIARFEP